MFERNERTFTLAPTRSVRLHVLDTSRNTYLPGQFLIGCQLPIFFISANVICRLMGIAQSLERPVMAAIEQNLKRADTSSHGTKVFDDYVRVPRQIDRFVNLGQR